MWAQILPIGEAVSLDGIIFPPSPFLFFFLHLSSFSPLKITRSLDSNPLNKQSKGALDKRFGLWFTTCVMNILFRAFFTETIVLHIHFATQLYDDYDDYQNHTEWGFLFTHHSKQTKKKIYKRINIKVGKFRIVNILVCWVLLQTG